MLHEGLKYVSRETTGQKERFMHEDLLKRHLELVIEANKTTNITRISSWEDGMVLHVQDSLLGLDALNACPEGRYADIGTGAGYPGIPLAIETSRPTLLVDSVQKKVQILDGFIEELGLDNVSTYAVSKISVASRLGNLLRLVPERCRSFPFCWSSLPRC